MDFPRIDKGIPIGLDYETSGLDYWSPDFRVHNVAVAVPGQAWAFDFRSHPGAREWLADLLPGREVAAHFAQYEYQCTRVLKIDPRSIDWYCTMTAACLIDEHRMTYNLASVCDQFGVDSKKIENLSRIMEALGVDTPSAALAAIGSAPADLVAMYVAGDATDALEVYYSQKHEIGRQELERVIQLERNLIPVLADMSWGGIRVDLEAAHAAIPRLDEQELLLQAEVNEISGRKLNVNSPVQLREFFNPEPINKYQWQLIDGTLVGPTKGGKSPSLDAKAMLEIKHPLAAKVLALRKTIKLRDTFIRGHVIGSADGEGYVHTTFNQTRNDADAGTITGRLSSTDPALQQITKRDKVNASILRAMFLPDPGEDWLCADYSQVDFRCGAHLQNDPNVIAAYWEDPSLDYHQIVSDMTGIPRNAPYAGAPYTKQINLGLSFGAGTGKLAFMMNMPFTVKESRGKMQYVAGQEAIDIFNLYHRKLPAVKEFMKKAENVAKETGFVKTAIGRRLRFPRGMGAHKAAGLLYQSYAADLHKWGLVMVDRAIQERKLPARMNMSCHDEIGVSMRPDPEVKQIIQSAYTNFNSDTSPIKMRVPITASGDFGANWWEASK